MFMDRVIRLAPVAGRPRRSTATPRNNAAASRMLPKANIQIGLVLLVVGRPTPWIVAGVCRFAASVDTVVSRAETGSGWGVSLAKAFSIAEEEAACAPAGAGALGGVA